MKQLLAQAEPYRFILGARDTERTKKAYDELEFDSATHSVTVLPLELSNLKGVKSFSQQTLHKLGADKLDYLFLNAGMAKGAEGPGLHGSKWCEPYIVNHLCKSLAPAAKRRFRPYQKLTASIAQHYLTHLLREKLVASKSRVIIVSSGAVRRVTDPGTAPLSPCITAVGVRLIPFSQAYSTRSFLLDPGKGL